MASIYNVKRMVDERKRRLEHLAGLAVKEEELYTKLKGDLGSVRKTAPNEELLVIGGKTSYSGVLKKAGTVLVLSSPIPVVSDVVGASLLTLGVLSEYRKRRKLRWLLTDYSYEIINGSLL